MAGVLRHREDWNRYAKRTLGKDCHQHFWDEDKRQRTERDELNQITTGMSGRKHVIEGHRAEASPPWKLEAEPESRLEADVPEVRESKDLRSVASRNNRSTFWSRISRLESL